jgi:hypothetical protein
MVFSREPSLDEVIRAALNIELDKAEATWNKVEYLLNETRNYFEKGGEIPSLIPGFPFVQDGKPKVGNFIALVLDIRDSSIHLTQRISERIAKASELQRVYYETTAVNTAGSIIIRHYQGKITEYLGDGFLALFQVIDQADPDEDVYAAHNAAKKCLSTITGMVNEVLAERYQLPKLEIGIGLAYSKAIVTLVGTEDNLHAKAIGKCVWRATKISDLRNEIRIDDALYYLWPVSKNGGGLNFTGQPTGHGFDAYKTKKQVT